MLYFGMFFRHCKGVLQQFFSMVRRCCQLVLEATSNTNEALRHGHCLELVFNSQSSFVQRNRFLFSEQMMLDINLNDCTQSTRPLADLSIMSCEVTIATARYCHMSTHAFAITLKERCVFEEKHPSAQGHDTCC